MPDEEKTNVPPADQSQTPNLTPPTQEPVIPAASPPATSASEAPSLSPEPVPSASPAPVVDPDRVKAADPAPADPPVVPNDPSPLPPAPPAGTVDPIAAPPQVPTTVGAKIPQPTPTSPTAAAYAGFWIRFLAYILDSVLIWVAASIINLVFGFGLAFRPNMAGENPSAETAGLFAGFIGAAFLIQLVVTLCYYVGLTGLYGATLGKMVLGLRVVDSSGQKIGIPKAALREIVGKFVSGIVFALGYIWVAFDEKKQGLHDKIAGTFVVKIR